MTRVEDGRGAGLTDEGTEDLVDPLRLMSRVPSIICIGPRARIRNEVVETGF